MRQLYKQFLLIGREYPEPFVKVRDRIKKGFQANSKCCDNKSVEKALERGYFVLKEVEALIRLRKYRTLNKRYGKDADRN